MKITIEGKNYIICDGELNYPSNYSKFIMVYKYVTGFRYSNINSVIDITNGRVTISNKFIGNANVQLLALTIKYLVVNSIELTTENIITSIPDILSAIGVFENIKAVG